MSATTVKCPACEGFGTTDFYEDATEEYQFEAECPVCLGFGDLVCEDCNGKGSINSARCDACKGVPYALREDV